MEFRGALFLVMESINGAAGARCGRRKEPQAIRQHCKEKNLHRYLAEFDFRHNARKMTDSERAVLALRGGAGKRLTHRQPH
jgi:hypothetical protein